eukprot:CAMPEP_0185256410 /NCGR_PEP_ID=MMETSP1359-20130426/5520_1 /TAXON_ID=552665 /ORGANISM="Bigelowiella longifila, Strain CCMP242" /LENGTH=92 /DNA_ID=CAMNT_0027840975 /DNA_START=542 /DNA_END=817 /DNA_ORIENTATION=+
MVFFSWRVASFLSSEELAKRDLSPPSADSIGVLACSITTLSSGIKRELGKDDDDDDDDDDDGEEEEEEEESNKSSSSAGCSIPCDVVASAKA